MLTLFVYPVSAVMKLWHWVLTELFSLDASTAWIISIFGLVVTVRTLLIPVAWAQKKSSRANTAMRPEKAALEEKYGHSTDPDDIAALQEKTKELHRRFDYNPAVGCVTPLVQIPVILGLYRLLLWMSRPDLLPQHENSSGGIGVLSADDVQSFADARLFDVPVSAYLAMPAERMAEMGTTPEHLWSVVFPFVVAAAVFTTMNTGLSTYISFRDLDWRSTTMRVMLRVMIGVVIIMPVMILLLGTQGILPFALVLYWVTGNLWTTVQLGVIDAILRARWPETDLHREYRRKGRQELADARQAQRDRRAAERSHVATATERGSTRAEARAENKRRRAEETQARKEAADETKRLRREASRARGELKAKEFQERRAKKRGDQME